MEILKVKKISKVVISGRSDAEEKINLMLKNGWQILSSYKQADEIAPYQYSETLIFVLAHEDANAEIPMTNYEREIESDSWKDDFKCDWLNEDDS